MTRPSTRAGGIARLCAAVVCAAAPAVGGPLGEPHLDIVARSPAEAARVAAVTAPATDFAAPEPFEQRPGGGATAMAPASARSFLAPSANLTEARKLDVALGQALFEKLWVAAPSATLASDGLGPLYNARACSICHPGNGRGRPPQGDEDRTGSLVLRVSVPDAASPLTPAVLARLPSAPEPRYGAQIQDKSLPGLPAEGRVGLRTTPVPVTLGDGSIVTLHRPAYSLEAPGYGPLHPAARLSPRVAPPMIGLGLLEAIPESDILARADPEDSDGDGISGRANRVWSPVHGQWMTGRFGLKAASPTVRDQSADALNGDIGLSNPHRPAASGDCTAAQPGCRAAPDGNTPAQDGLEASSLVMDLITLYARNAAPPQRRDIDDAQVLAGKALFHRAGCAACHAPKFVTHRLADRPEQSFQLIWPYSDLLLHDMGPGLADGGREWLASGREWRTAPLWGIGLTQTVGGHTTFLHDGRARSLLEAILWHGGEARPARETVRLMERADRDALIAFLESL